METEETNNKLKTFEGLQQTEVPTTRTTYSDDP